MPLSLADAAFGRELEDVNGFGKSGLRAALRAATSPGEIVTIDSAGQLPGAVSPAAFAVCAGLIGIDSRFWLSTDLRRNRRLLASLRFLCGAQGCANSRNASFALMNGTEWDGPDRFRYGEADAPHVSTTVIVEVDELRAVEGVVIQCDGQQEGRALEVRGIDPRFWSDINRNYRRAPCGLDFLLTCRNRLAAVTRHCFVTCSTR